MARFQLRAFVSLALGVSFLVAAVSGLVLWLAPHPLGPGGGSLTLGLSKGVWKNAHIYVSLMMLVAGVWHLVLNWSVFWSYVWDRAVRRLHQKWELSLALVVVAAVAWASSFGGHGGPPRFGPGGPPGFAEQKGRQGDFNGTEFGPGSPDQADYGVVRD